MFIWSRSPQLTRPATVSIRIESGVQNRPFDDVSLFNMIREFAS